MKAVSPSSRAEPALGAWPGLITILFLLGGDSWQSGRHRWQWRKRFRRGRLLRLLEATSIHGVGENSWQTGDWQLSDEICDSGF
jgi:hypothetical protein